MNEEISGEKILVTGGYGYVGARVSNYLELIGYKVLRGTRIHKDCENSIGIDYENSTSLNNATKGVKVIVHLAGLNESDCQIDSRNALIVNGLYTKNLLDSAIVNSVSKFIYISTAHVYGAPLAGNIDENNITYPISTYAITHKVAEDFVLSERKKGRIDGIVLRLSNSFGCPINIDISRWELLVNDLCRQVVNHHQITLRSKGNQIRDFITLSDVERAIEHMIQTPTIKLGNGLFNIGGDMALSIYDMAKLVKDRWAKLSGEEIEIIRGPDNQDDIEIFNFSSKKIKSIGFQHKSNVNEEIDSTLLLCSENYK